MPNSGQPRPAMRSRIIYIVIIIIIIIDVVKSICCGYC